MIILFKKNLKIKKTLIPVNDNITNTRDMSKK